MLLIQLQRNSNVSLKLIATLESFFPRLHRLHDVDSRGHGGYLSLRSHASGELTFVYGIGLVLPEKAVKYLQFSQEKSARLFLHHEHKSSWQSRFPENDRYGGAIRTVDGLLSFSGLPEDLDEALVLAVGYGSGLLSLPDARAIAVISQNQKFEPVFDLLGLES